MKFKIFFFNKTAFYRAVEKENIEVINILLYHEDDKKKYPFQEIKYLHYYCHIKYDNWESYKSELDSAIENENIEIIKILLSNNCDVKYRNNNYFESGGGDYYYWYYTPLFQAIEIENIKIVELLLNSKEIDINRNINVKYIDYQGGGDPKEGRFYQTALFRAVELENVEIVKLLLSNKKINPNMYNKRCNLDEGGIDDLWDRVPLYEAVNKENIEIIKLLLESDIVDINFPNIEHDDNDDDDCGYISYSGAFDLAIKKGNIEIIKLFLTKNDTFLCFQYDLFGNGPLNTKYYDDELKQLLTEYKTKMEKLYCNQSLSFKEKIKKIKNGEAIFDDKVDLYFSIRKILRNHFNWENRNEKVHTKYIMLCNVIINELCNVFIKKNNKKKVIDENDILFIIKAFKKNRRFYSIDDPEMLDSDVFEKLFQEELPDSYIDDIYFTGVIEELLHLILFLIINEDTSSIKEMIHIIKHNSDTAPIWKILQNIEEEEDAEEVSSSDAKKKKSAFGAGSSGFTSSAKSSTPTTPNQPNG